MKTPDLVSEFEYEGRVIVEWYDVFNIDEIPDFNWQQVYIIGNLAGKVPVVMYSNQSDNLPGGKVEHGESLEQALIRETQEELNMRVVSWVPLGYQRLTRPLDDTPTYQFRAYAKLEKIDDFVNDPGGGVIGHKLVELDEVNQFINYGDVGEHLISKVKHHFI